LNERFRVRKGKSGKDSAATRSVERKGWYHGGVGLNPRYAPLEEKKRISKKGVEDNQIGASASRKLYGRGKYLWRVVDL